MEDQINSLLQMTEKSIQSSVTKANNPAWKSLVGGMMAGAFVALGACSSTVAMHGTESVGIARMLGGLVFPVGLILIVLIGGELFTGNCLLVMGVAQKKISMLNLLRNLLLVFIGNMLGSILMALLVVNSGQLGYSGNLLGAYAINMAVGKANLPLTTSFVSGILCNILVCAAVFVALAAKDAVGKIFCIFFPIFAFVIAGFEHCVANMYYLSAGIFAAMRPEYADKAVELYGYSADKLSSLNWGTMFVNNLLPVTLGNFVGGAVFVAIPIYVLSCCHNKK